jgi:hypothetical protein
MDAQMSVIIKEETDSGQLCSRVLPLLSLRSVYKGHLRGRAHVPVAGSEDEKYKKGMSLLAQSRALLNCEHHHAARGDVYLFRSRARGLDRRAFEWLEGPATRGHKKALAVFNRKDNWRTIARVQSILYRNVDLSDPANIADLDIAPTDQIWESTRGKVHAGEYLLASVHQSAARLARVSRKQFFLDQCDLRVWDPDTTGNAVDQVFLLEIKEFFAAHGISPRVGDRLKCPRRLGEGKAILRPYWYQGKLYLTNAPEGRDPRVTVEGPLTGQQDCACIIPSIISQPTDQERLCRETRGLITSALSVSQLERVQDQIRQIKANPNPAAAAAAAAAAAVRPPVDPGVLQPTADSKASGAPLVFSPLAFSKETQNQVLLRGADYLDRHYSDETFASGTLKVREFLSLINVSGQPKDSGNLKRMWCNYIKALKGPKKWRDSRK